jgi:hypothetical protein
MIDSVEVNLDGLGKFFIITAYGLMQISLIGTMAQNYYEYYIQQCNPATIPER